MTTTDRSQIPSITVFVVALRESGTFVKHRWFHTWQAAEEFKCAVARSWTTAEMFEYDECVDDFVSATKVIGGRSVGILEVAVPADASAEEISALVLEDLK